MKSSSFFNEFETWEKVFNDGLEIIARLDGGIPMQKWKKVGIQWNQYKADTLGVIFLSALDSCPLQTGQVYENDL